MNHIQALVTFVALIRRHSYQQLVCEPNWYMQKFFTKWLRKLWSSHSIELWTQQIRLGCECFVLRARQEGHHCLSVCPRVLSL